MYLNQIMLGFRDRGLIFLPFHFFPRTYKILSNNVENSVFQTMQDYCLVPIVRKECHKKFNQSLNEFKQFKHFWEYK